MKAILAAFNQVQTSFPALDRDHLYAASSHVKTLVCCGPWRRRSPDSCRGYCSNRSQSALSLYPGRWRHSRPRSIARRGGGFIPQFYTGLRCGVDTRYWTWQSWHCCGCAAGWLGWAAAITTHLHFLIVERWSQIYSAPPATREHWESKYIMHNVPKR